MDIISEMKRITDQTDKVRTGIRKAARIIRSTMGARGRNVYINGSFTKDGVSVAKALEFEDPEEQIGCNLLVAAADKTVKKCGDGTTLTSLFLGAMMDFTEENPKTLTARLRECIDRTCAELDKVKAKITGTDDIFNIAYTSSRDLKIANFIKSIYSEINTEAAIDLRFDPDSATSYFEVTKGLRYECGFIHPSFATEKDGSCVFNDPIIYWSETPVNNIGDYEQFIENAHASATPVVMIAPDFSNTFIRYCLTNKTQNDLEICLIRQPGYGNAIRENREDFLAFCPDNTCTEIKVTPLETIIYNGADVTERVNHLSARINSTTEFFEVDDFTNRINMLLGNTAVIYVGGVTQHNAKEEYDRIEDAIGAVKSAIRDGFVRGSGIELYNIETGYPEFDRMLKRPYLTIMHNAKATPLDNPVECIDLNTGKPDHGIIDPVYTIKTALENAFAIFILLTDTSYLIYEP